LTTYIIRRILQSVVVLLIVTMIVFLAMRLLPGDPILMLITSDDLAEASEEEIQALRKEFGLDKCYRGYFRTITHNPVLGVAGFCH
jgi:peptide/nickel transport system permease protein